MRNRARSNRTVGWRACLTNTLIGARRRQRDHRESRVPRVHILDFLEQGFPYPLHDALDHLLVGRAKRCRSGGAATPAFRSMSFIMSISILVARRSAPAALLTI
jgi:hypothetical protein